MPFACTFNISTEPTVTYNIKVEVSRYYTGTPDEASITVYKPDGKDFITGGGTISASEVRLNIPTSPSVQVDAKRKVNFGFSIKWNKSVKNTQGFFNLIFRGTDGNMYQIKATSLGATLGINSTDPCSQLASFSSKANFNNLTNETTIGGLSLFVTMTDNGSPGIDKDKIRVELWNGSSLVLATYLTDSPYETWLTGGNIMIQSGVKCTASNLVANNSITSVKPLDVSEVSDLKVYPNPFDERLRIEFVSLTNADAILDIFDAIGRKVKTIFEGSVEGGVLYKAEFIPATSVSGMYFYRLTLGKEVFNGKVIYEK